MADFEELGHGIYAIDAHYVTPRVASIYLLQQDDEVAIIETGTRHSVQNVLATLKALNITKAQIRYVIPTHVHLDHAGGAGTMMRHFEQAELLIHPRGARHMIDPEQLIAGTMRVYGENRFKRLYGEIEPVDPSRIQVIGHEKTVSLASRQLVFIDTPGHARHHFCIFDEASRGFFTGDSFGVSYDSMKSLTCGLLPTTPPTQFDPEALHLTIDQIMRFEPQQLYLTHYGTYPSPINQVDHFHRWIDTYVELTQQHKPQTQEDGAHLESALTRIVLDALADAAQPLDRLLKTDMRLNAQGLAWWWRTQAT